MSAPHAAPAAHDEHHDAGHGNEAGHGHHEDEGALSSIMKGLSNIWGGIRKQISDLFKFVGDGLHGFANFIYEKSGGGHGDHEADAHGHAPAAAGHH